MMESETQLSSNRLFHFTTREGLLGILESGFKINISFERIYNNNNKIINIFSSQGNIDDSENSGKDICIPMCCFCDIPLEFTTKHSGIYGNYAISFSKDWGIKKGISPLWYIPDNGKTMNYWDIISSLIERNLPKQLEQFKKNNEKSSEGINPYLEADNIDFIQLFNNLQLLLTLLKPYKGDYEKDGVLHKDYKFYDEREWRYVPKSSDIKHFLFPDEYRNKETLNSFKRLFGNLEFQSENVCDIIVPEQDVEYFRNLISGNKRYQHYDLKKIDSLEKKLKTNS